MDYQPQGIKVKDIDALLDIIGSDYETRSKYEYHNSRRPLEHNI